MSFPKSIEVVLAGAARVAGCPGAGRAPRSAPACPPSCPGVPPRPQAPRAACCVWPRAQARPHRRPGAQSHRPCRPCPRHGAWLSLSHAPPPPAQVTPPRCGRSRAPLPTTGPWPCLTAPPPPRGPAPSQGFVQTRLAGRSCHQHSLSPPPPRVSSPVSACSSGIEGGDSQAGRMAPRLTRGT